MKVKVAVLGYPSLINLMVSVDVKQHFFFFFVFVLFVCLFLLLFWSLFCFVASDFLTICHLAIVNVCVNVILSIGNSNKHTAFVFPVLICGTCDHDE